MISCCDGLDNRRKDIKRKENEYEISRRKLSKNKGANYIEDRKTIIKI